MPFLLPNQQCQNTEGKKSQSITIRYKLPSNVALVYNLTDIVQWDSDPLTLQLTFKGLQLFKDFHSTYNESYCQYP